MANQKTSELGEARPARFFVGIDLGTTNSALAYLDGNQSEPRIRDFPIPQIVAPGEIEARAVLPSFAYEPVPGEFPAGTTSGVGVSAGGRVIGWFARRHGGQSPGRLISSAKSWLCHPGVNRTAPLLPWHGAPDVARISPVEASAEFLTHLRVAWDAAFPEHPLAAQELALTVPASFDEVARGLTVRAAEKAGLTNLTLLEEPQAAFYAWMAAGGVSSEQGVQAGQLTLICDVGGGTSDFTLIEARPAGEGRVRFHRVAVGDHLLLGGDNMDLALAHHVERRLVPNGRLDPRPWGLLLHACRQAKETLLGSEAPERLTVSVATGARLIGGALQVEVTRDEVKELVLDGFFPKVPWGSRPSLARSGFQEFGLPYAADPAVTRHLAAFLEAHFQRARAEQGVPLFPDRVLFNGGVFESQLLMTRVVEVLEGWREELGVGGAPITVLPNERLDLAVARGAAHAAWLRKQPGRRIAAGLARAYYIEVSRQGEERTAVCLAPAGLEEGQGLVLPRRFTLRVRQPVEFTLFTSTTRLQDAVGDLVSVNPEQLTPLSPIRTVVSSGKFKKGEPATAEVELHVRLTEIGTLDVRCVDPAGRRSWKLEFDVRGGSRSADAGRRAGTGVSTALAPEEDVVVACGEWIRRVFKPEGGVAPEDPAGLVRKLEEVTSLRRDQWPLALLRALWAELLEAEPGRRLGAMHEARWLNLLGFSLRPGFGYAVDDWRVQQTWRLFAGGTVFPKNEMCRAEWCILWRRIAGGLSAAHQRALTDAWSGMFRPRAKKAHYGPHETSEIWRLLGSLESIAIPVKTEIGNFLMERLERRIDPPLEKAGWWAIGRLGARVPAYGPLNTIVPTDVVELWIARILSRIPSDPEMIFAVVQMTRPTGDRYRDVSDSTRAAVLEWLEQHRAPEHQIALVREGGTLESAEEEQVFGETLPPGLHLE